MLGKCRRIKNDQIIFVLLHFIKEPEGVGCVSLVTLVTREIEGDVRVGEGRGFCRRVNRVDALSSAPHRIDRKTARVAEHIEDITAAGVFLQKRAVVPLVNEETGLLTAKPVNVELQSVLESDVSVVCADEIFILRIEVRLIWERRLRFVEYVSDPGVGKGDEGIGDLPADEVHTRRMSLDNGGVAVNIHNETGKEITLTVNETERVVIFTYQSESLSQAVGFGEPLREEVSRKMVCTEFKDADRDTADLIMAGSESFAFRGNDRHEIPLFDSIGHGSHGS